MRYMSQTVKDLPGTRAVRINGALVLVPSDELTDPHADLPTGGCDAEEPGEWGGAVCTLAPHDPAVMHIAHGGEASVIAMWYDPAGQP